MTAPAATTRPAASPDQSDLWFLAAEPAVEGGHNAEAVSAPHPSPLLTTGLTVGMVVVVVFLVLVFLYMMTSLLH